MENRRRTARLVQRLLDELIRDPKVPLNYKNPFELLVATLLSARCTDDRVNQITDTLFTICPTPVEMALLPIEKLTSLIRECGLCNRKAKALHDLANILVQQFDAQVPSSFEALESLPGVGHKTASCVMAQAFHRPAFPVDTHIFRVAHRWGLSEGTTVEAVERDLKTLFPKKLWSRLHLQMILYARRFCPAKKHDLATCTICRQVQF